MFRWITILFENIFCTLQPLDVRNSSMANESENMDNMDTFNFHMKSDATGITTDLVMILYL